MPARWVCSYNILDELAKRIRGKNPSYMVSVKGGRFKKLEVRLKKCEEVGWQGFIVEFDWHSVNWVADKITRISTAHFASL